MRSCSFCKITWKITNDMAKCCNERLQWYGT